MVDFASDCNASGLQDLLDPPPGPVVGIIVRLEAEQKLSELGSGRIEDLDHLIEDDLLVRCEIRSGWLEIIDLEAKGKEGMVGRVQRSQGRFRFRDVHFPASLMRAVLEYVVS